MNRASINGLARLSLLCAALSGCGAPPSLYGEPAITQVQGSTTPADMAMVAPYPSGPYGNMPGSTLADFHVNGYRLTPKQTDSTQLMWDTTIELSDFHSNPACSCLLITFGATWCGACQQEQPTLISDVMGDPSFCVLNILQEGPTQGTTATKADVDNWTQHFKEDYTVVQGDSTTARLWDGYGSVIGLPFNLMVKPSTMTVESSLQGYDPTIHDKAVAACAM